MYKVQNIEGVVSIKRGDEVFSASEGMSLLPNDQIITDSGSKVLIQGAGGLNSATLSENSIAAISAFNGPSGSSMTELVILEGEWTVIDERGNVLSQGVESSSMFDGLGSILGAGAGVGAAAALGGGSSSDESTRGATSSIDQGVPESEFQANGPLSPALNPIQAGLAEDPRTEPIAATIGVFNQEGTTDPNGDFGDAGLGELGEPIPAFPEEVSSFFEQTPGFETPNLPGQPESGRESPSQDGMTPDDSPEVESPDVPGSLEQPEIPLGQEDLNFENIQSVMTEQIPQASAEGLSAITTMPDTSSGVIPTVFDAI